MTRRPNVFSIPAGVPFLPTLADAFLHGQLVPGFDIGKDELDIADTTIYVPTRRAARSLRGILVERMDAKAAILPEIRPLGDFDEDGHLFEAGVDTQGTAILNMAPPIGRFDRLVALAPLIKAWKSRLPAHVAALFGEELVVPASTADALWLAGDLAALIDDVETEGVAWSALGSLVPAELAEWWQVTLDFLKIVTTHWPEILAERQNINPAAHRNMTIDAETARLKGRSGGGPVIAAGSTGSIPATAKLLAAVARDPRGAVVLPGLDLMLDEKSWALVGDAENAPSVFGHPQYGLKKLIETIGAARREITEIGAADQALAARARLVNEAMRPAETTDRWADNVDDMMAAIEDGALDEVTLIEAANEREEALAVAAALRIAINEPGRRAALVTGDRNLARRVSSELLRFGIRANDSGGRPLSLTPAGRLLHLIAETAFRPGDPTNLLDLFSHPLVLLGRPAVEARHLGALAELILLRGGTGRPDIADIVEDFERRLAQHRANVHPPQWLERMADTEAGKVRDLIAQLGQAFQPVCTRRKSARLGLRDAVTALARTLEAIVIDADGGLAGFYGEEDGTALADMLHALLAIDTDLECRPDEVPDILQALMAGESVKPSAAVDGRVAIWGILEARLQSVDTLVIGGLNEASWPRKPEVGRFMSRMLAMGIGLEPPERRTGQAAHDFQMAMGTRQVVLARSIRADGAPTSPSRWLQRLCAVAGVTPVEAMTGRGRQIIALATSLDETDDVPLASQPCPAPPLDARPVHFSVTEIETLRRDPYAIYARRILGLRPLEPLRRDPGAAERGSLFHDILHRFIADGINAKAPEAEAQLIDLAGQCFDRAALPPDVRAVWWPRFLRMAPQLIEWEARKSEGVAEKFAEVASKRIVVGASNVTLSGRADRIDLLDGRQFADILDYKTGVSPTRKQARTLLSPQLALEAALVRKGAFEKIGPVEPSRLLFVRLKADGTVTEESVLGGKGDDMLPAEFADAAWSQLERLIGYYANPKTGYRSRALPFRQHDMEGDYDHLARALEWSAANGGSEDGGGE